MNILITSVPGTWTQTPILAPALLKACLQAEGFSSTAIDLNFEANELINKYPNKDSVTQFFLDQNITDDTWEQLYELLEYCTTRIKEYNPDLVCLSLLTQDCQFFTYWLCYNLRYRIPNTRIVIGGSGIKGFIAQGNTNFAELLQSKGFIDDYINGDGEYSLPAYVRGMSHTGINTMEWDQIKDLNALPVPNFDDYNLHDYPRPSIPVCDSRGCIRSCEFCDIVEHWTKYRFRTAENLWQEMLTQVERYGITHFEFHNSLTNGNMREFTKVLDHILEYNSIHEQKISWNGYFIVRSERSHPEALWQKIKDTNGNLMLGVESVVEHIRIGLGKNFTNDSLDYHLDMIKKYKINSLLMLIVAYPTETLEDMEYTKKWFTERADYACDYINVLLSEAQILPNTELARQQENYSIQSGDTPQEWNKTGLTNEQRVKYNREVSDLLQKLGFSHVSMEAQHS